jgi:hypothetical protein
MKHQTWGHPTLMTLSDALRISISPVAAIACSLAMLSDEAAAGEMLIRKASLSVMSVGWPQV